MDLGLRGKTVLVTGATRGIGRAVALAYAGEGARVGLTYATDAAAAASAVDEIRARGGDAAALHLELTDVASIAAAIHATVARFGSLDVLVANAVRWPEGARGPLAETGVDAWTRAMRANLEGTTATVRSAMRHLNRSSAGRVVMISSGLSRVHAGRDSVCGCEGRP